MLHKKSNSDVHEMLHTKGINWANLALHWKNGTFIYKTETGFKIDTKTIFTESRNIVEQYMRWE